MGEVVLFPDTFEEFVEQYKIVDTKNVYTNGADLIPVFRVERWLHHETERRAEEENVLYTDDPPVIKLSFYDPTNEQILRALDEIQCGKYTWRDSYAGFNELGMNKECDDNERDN